MVKRFDVFLINLDEAPSDDPKNTRPGVVVSPDELNRYLDHVLIAPLSSTTAKYPTRMPADFLNARRYLILDQIRSVDKSRLVKKIGELDKKTRKGALELLHEMFAE